MYALSLCSADREEGCCGAYELAGGPWCLIILAQTFVAGSMLEYAIL